MAEVCLFEQGKGRTGYKDRFIVMITLAANVVLAGICFDFYYDMNDDVFVRDIVSGRYTGIPDGHNVQTLYLLGKACSLLYRLCRNIPWYGIILILCQAGCLWLTGVRILGLCEKKAAKMGCMIALSVFIWGVILPHTVALHNTFVSAMLAAAAVFLFMTTPEGLSPGQFVRENIPSVLLVVLSYQIRSDMLLLVFPFICLAGLFRWSEEKVFFQKDHFRRYGTVFVLIVAGMLVSRIVDFAAYGSEEWQEFFAFNHARSEIYDFHRGALAKGEYRDYLYSVGVSDAQQQVLDNYNFGIDERIDAAFMEKFAEHALAETDYTAGIGQKIRVYMHRTLYPDDAPYNWIVIFLYGCLAIEGIHHAVSYRRQHDGEEPERPCGKQWSFLWKLIALGGVRTVLWMFLLIRERVPERITHSLCLVEIMLLAGMLLREMRFWKKEEGGMKGQIKSNLPAVLFGLFCACLIPGSVRTTAEREESREISHQACRDIDSYCRAHPENFYFKDVYPTVGTSQKIFQDVDNSPANHDIMGGWLCKSPLYREKLSCYGIETMEEGLLSMDSVFFLTTQDADVKWLSDYYAGNGILVDVERADTVSEQFAVYRVKRTDALAKNINDGF